MIKFKLNNQIVNHISNISASNAIMSTLLVMIHPFMDGNGRSARIISELMLKNYGYDSKKLFSLDAYYEENLSEYYAFLDQGVDYYEDRVGVQISEWIVFYLRSLDIVYDAIKDETIKLFQSDQKSNQKILYLIKEDNKISISKLAQTLNMSESGIKKIIKQLKVDGLLEREGFKAGHWIVKESDKYAR